MNANEDEDEAAARRQRAVAWKQRQASKQMWHDDPANMLHAGIKLDEGAQNAAPHDEEAWRLEPALDTIVKTHKFIVTQLLTTRAADKSVFEKKTHQPSGTSVKGFPRIVSLDIPARQLCLWSTQPESIQSVPSSDLHVRSSAAAQKQILRLRFSSLHSLSIPREHNRRLLIRTVDDSIPSLDLTFAEERHAELFCTLLKPHLPAVGTGVLHGSRTRQFHHQSFQDGTHGASWLHTRQDEPAQVLSVAPDFRTMPGTHTLSEFHLEVKPRSGSQREKEKESLLFPTGSRAPGYSPQQLAHVHIESRRVPNFIVVYIYTYIYTHTRVFVCVCVYVCIHI